MHIINKKWQKHTVILFAFFISAIQLVSAHSKYKAVQTLTPWIPGYTGFGNAYGLTVRLNNDYLFVSDPLAQPIGNPASGAIYIYKREDSQWVNSQVISTDGFYDVDGELTIEAQNEWLMFSVFATPFGPTPSVKTFQGSVQIYKLNRNNGQYEFFQVLDGNTPGLSDLAAFPVPGFPILTIDSLVPQQGATFGLIFSLDAKNKRLMVGAANQPTPDSSAINPGAVYAFEIGNDGFWYLTQTIYSPDGPSNQNAFGSAVSIKNKHALISNGKAKTTPKMGPLLDDGNSSVYVYHFNKHTNLWEYTEQKIHGDQTTTPLIPFTTTPIADSFGAVLALHKKWAFISAPFESINPSLASMTGAVYIYKFKKKHGIKQYVRKQKIYSDDPQDFVFGYTRIATSKNRAVISDSGRMGPGGVPYQGGMLVLKLKNGKWKKEETLYDPNGFINNFFGAGVDIQGNMIVGGAVAEVIVDAVTFGFLPEAPFHIPFFVTFPIPPTKVVVFEKCS